MSEQSSGFLPPLVLTGTAVVAVVALLAITLLGPLGIGTLRYPTSQSAIWQVQATDLVNAVLIAPILLAGALLHLVRRSAAKYLLVLPAMDLFYTGLTYGVGEEWNSSVYSGNSYAFAPLFLVLIVASVLLTIGGLSLFHAEDAPELSRRAVRRLAAVLLPFLALFAFLWLSQIVQVITTGNTSDGSYGATPTSFWIVRYLDLGVTIPLGILLPYLLWTHARGAYPLAILFAGYFVTLGTTVVAMGAILAYHHDPSVQGANAVQLVLFPVLCGIAWWILYVLLRPKFTSFRAIWRPSRPHRA